MTRAALITGAGSGLTQATARLLAEAGFSLALVGADHDTLDEVHDDLTLNAPSPHDPIKIVLVEADVSNGEGAAYAVEAARRLLDCPIETFIGSEGDAFALDMFTTQLLEDGKRGSAVMVGQVESLVEATAATYAAQGLRINGVRRAAARILTLDEWSEALETARTIRWLLSEEARWITGQMVPEMRGDSDLGAHFSPGPPTPPTQ